LTAEKVVYKSYPNAVTLDGMVYATGAQQVTVESGEIEFGDSVALFGSFNITRGAIAGQSTVTRVAFSNAGFRVIKDGKTMVTVAGEGRFLFREGQVNGPKFAMQSFAVTNFEILPADQTELPTFARIGPVDPMAKSGSAGTSGFDPVTGELVPTPVRTPKTYTLGPVTLVDPKLTVGNFTYDLDKETKLLNLSIDDAFLFFIFFSSLAL
jgi:hypothetical protein